MFTSYSMLGSVLICGGSKKMRLEKAWDLLLERGFEVNAECPDLLIVQKEGERKSIGIAQAKVVKKFLRERPFLRKVKAVVIEDVQLLTDDAQGSLLKVLEEPPSFGLIILLCDKEGSLLPTVVSRCQKVAVARSAAGCEEWAGSGGPFRADRSQAGPSYNIVCLSYGEIFDLAKDLSAKGKDETLEFLENVLRHDVRNGFPLPVVHKMELSIRELREANVALKFALEYLFLLHRSHVW